MKQFGLFVFLLFSFRGYAQQTDYVDFKTAKITIGIIPDSSKVMGMVDYEFKILKPADSIYINAVNMNFNNVFIVNNKVSYRNDGKKLWLKSSFKKDSLYNVSFNYYAYPKKALYYIDWENAGKNQQIWTQGQGKYTSNWLPSIDDMNDKMVFDLTVTFDKQHEVIANGKLTSKQFSDSTTTWHYQMIEPMSSYLVALAIGKYNKKTEYSKSSIPLEMYYYPEDSLKVEPTYRYTKQMFDFLEDEIGVSYPWQNYKQVPVKDFLYAGMENTSVTFFSDGFVIDSIAFIDKNYVNVNAHELAHQWFGDLVTEQSGTHHWLQEGFATYYALLAEREIFGEDHYYWKLYEYAQELLQQDEVGQGTILLDPKASSLTFYKQGAWALHVLREYVGDVNFKKAVKNYLKEYEFKNVETKDFLVAVEKVSRKDLKAFTELWLKNEHFPYDEALNSLKQSKFIQDYLLVDCKEDVSIYKDYLVSEMSDEIKIKIIEKAPELVTAEAFNNSLKVRQAIAKCITQIPMELKEAYESLLHDKSYITIEVALYNLWNNFSENRVDYLKNTRDVIGFNDKNIRMLWLVLVLNTSEFEFENNQKYFEELRNYTSSNYDFETRQKAFQYLNMIQACDAICKDNLKQATKHHNWQFSKFAKEMLNQINN